MVAVSTLKRVALFGGVAALGGAVYFSEKIQDNFRQELYYRKSMSMLRRYKPAVEMFGEPIVSRKLDLGDTTNNRVDGLNARLQIPVRGPKDKGHLYLLASRTSAQDSWDIDQLELEVKSTGKRWIFYKKATENNDEFPS